MADIVLKDKLGEEKTYLGVKSVTLPTTDGSKVTFYQNTGDESFMFEMEELIPTTVGTFTYDESAGGYVYASSSSWSSSQFLTNGETGIVVWDGIPYGITCGKKACLITVNGVETKAWRDDSIGNAALWTKHLGYDIDTDFSETPEPFFIFRDNFLYVACKTPSEGSTATHTFQLFKFIHGAKIITFTVNGTTYTAKEGDTWLSSGLAAIGTGAGTEFYCETEDGVIMTTGGSEKICDPVGVEQTGNTIIADGMAYIIQA